MLKELINAFAGEKWYAVEVSVANLTFQHDRLIARLSATSNKKATG